MARENRAKPDSAAPVALLYTFRQWPLFEYLNEAARIPEALHDRACYLHMKLPGYPTRLFDRHPEPSLPARVAREGLRLNRAVYRLYYDDVVGTIAVDPTAQGTVKFGFHASEGVDVVRASFVEDGFRVVGWDEWADRGPAVFDEGELDARCASDLSALLPWVMPEERGADRHRALREALAARGMSKGWVLAASLRMCGAWPSFQAWVRTLVTRLDANVERLTELPSRRARAWAVRELFAELARQREGMHDARRGVRSWMERQRGAPAMQRVLAPSAGLFGL